MYSLGGAIRKGMLVSLLLKVMYSKQSIANSSCKYKSAHVCIFATHVERHLYDERTGTEIEQRSGAPKAPDRRGVRGCGTCNARYIKVVYAFCGFAVTQGEFEAVLRALNRLTGTTYTQDDIAGVAIVSRER